MSEEPGDDKEFDPSERRLEEARIKGEVPQGRDLLAAAAFGGLLLGGMMIGASGTAGLGEAGMTLLDQADQFSDLVFGGGSAPLVGLTSTILAALAPLFLLPFVLVVATLVAQRALVFAPSKLAPKLSRISPIQGARNKFGRSGLFEFGKNFVKLATISLALGLFLAERTASVTMALFLNPAVAAATMLTLLGEFLVVVLVLQSAIGMIDLLWQRADHLRRHRMSRKEMLDELRQSDGDPHLKAARRQRAVDIASSRMLADVATADVVIVNPTHYAVALKWNRASRRAPICVAKGVDEAAARIRERAAEAGVPIRHDPPTARALHATVEIGAEISQEQYRAVAAAVRFAEAMRLKARARGFWRRKR